MRRLGKKRFKFFREQGGFAFIETLAGLVIFAAIGVALMSGLSTGYKSMDISQESTYAESLAKSQVEYIKDQDYISVINYDSDYPDDPTKCYQVIDIPADLSSAGYAVEISPPEIPTIAGENTTAGVSGYELQSITIKVKRHGSGKLVITFYRTGLAL